MNLVYIYVFITLKEKVYILRNSKKSFQKVL